MTFVEAFNFITKGMRVTRTHWFESYKYIEVACDIKYTTLNCEKVNTTKGYKKSIALVTSNGTYVGWLPTNSDLFASDWIIYEPKKRKKVGLNECAILQE